MSDVRTLLGPLFPDETFSDSDSVYVERKTLVVGPEGGQPRTIVEEIWRGVPFEDDDVLVVETGRKSMVDSVQLPGEVTVDSFDGPAGPVNPLVWNPSNVSQDGNGLVVFPNDGGSNGVTPGLLVLLNTSSVVGKTVTANWAHLGAAGNGYVTSALYIKNPADTKNYWLSIYESGGTLKCAANAWSLSSKSLAYSATAHKQWRIRVSDLVYFETSPDGTTWTTQWTCPVPTWCANGCSYQALAGPWKIQTGLAATTLDSFGVA